MSKYPWPPESTAKEIIQWMRSNNADSCVVLVNVCDGMRLGCLVGSLSGMILHGIREAPEFYTLGAVSAMFTLIPREWLLQAAYSFREWLAR